MTARTIPQANFKAILQRRFPEADFKVSQFAAGNGLTISWEGPPDNQRVEVYLQGAGLLTNSDPTLPGCVRVRHPQDTPPQRHQMSQTAAKHTRPKRESQHSVRRQKAPISFGAQGLWSISDLEVIRVTAERWVSNLHSSSTIAYYVGGMTLLIIASGYLAWVLDIRPSLLFGQHLAAELASEWLNLRLLTSVIFLLSITPNLLEFFATGLAAHGNVIVDISIKAALLFDAATDAPMAYAIAQAFVDFFISEPSTWSDLVTIIMAIPILLFSTIVVEILFLSFLTAGALLLRRAWEVRQPRRPYGR